MRRLLTVLVLAVSLSGCATLGVLTTSVDNPVDKTTLAQVEQAVDLATKSLLVYRRSCLRGVADVHCRANIRAIQVYSRQVPPLVVQFRGFVRDNDQVNARVVYTQLMQLMDNAKRIAAARGVGAQ